MAAKGFTLVEVLITIGILALILALGLFVSLDVYRGFLHRSERDTLVALLERARSHAMANVKQASWGLCASGGNYVMFHGLTYAPAAVEESVATSSALVAGIPYCPSAIVFTELSGTTTATGPITVKDGAAPADTITINGEGTIIW